MSLLLLPGVLSQEETDAGGLPAADGIRRSNNTFTGYTNGAHTVSASSEAGQYLAWRGFDGIVTGANSYRSGLSSDPRWLAYDFGEDVTIRSARFRRHTVGGPEDFQFQTSGDGVVWTTRHEEVGFPDIDDWQTVIFSSFAAARHLRMYQTKGHDQLSLRLWEMEFYS